MSALPCPGCGGVVDLAAIACPTCAWTPPGPPLAPASLTAKAAPGRGRRRLIAVGLASALVAVVAGLTLRITLPQPPVPLQARADSQGATTGGGATPATGGGEIVQTRWLSVPLLQGFQVRSQSEDSVIVGPDTSDAFVQAFETDVQGQVGMDPTQAVLDQVRQDYPDAHVCGDTGHAALNGGAVPAVSLLVCFNVRSQDKSEPWTEMVQAAVVGGSASFPMLIETVVGAPQRDLQDFAPQVATAVAGIVFTQAPR